MEQEEEGVNVVFKTGVSKVYNETRRDIKIEIPLGIEEFDNEMKVSYRISFILHMRKFLYESGNRVLFC